MPSTLRRGAPLLLALALLAAPLAGQNSERVETVNQSRWTHSNIDNGHRLEIRGTGRVEFNDEGDWVVGLSPDGRMVVEEEGRGPERRADFRPAGNGVRLTYSVDGRERAIDSEGEAWLRRVIRQAVRESGLGAEARVARIRARRGVGGVLDEIGGIRSDVGRRMYFNALFAGAPLGEGEYVRAMREVGRMGSDVEKRLVLSQALREADGGARLAALLGATGMIDSDVETRLVLSQVISRHGLEDAAARSAFFSAVDRMDSGVERRLVLSPVLGRGNPSRPVVVSALRATGGIGSDVEKRLILMQLPAARLEDEAISRAYMDVVRGMRSDMERSLVLRHLARR
ncbi:MAG TPA: hypothetical protein VF613_19060 [Longimicrobium sp.]